MFEQTAAGEGIRSIIGDVRDSWAVGEALSAFEPEIVLDLAAQSIVRLSYDDPLLTLSTNVLGVASTLQALRAIPPPHAVVVITSDKCYAGSARPGPREGAARRPAAELRSPDATRPWQHVLEPLSGYLTLAEHLVAEGGAVAEAWNFGPAEDDAKPVRWIAATMAAFWGVGGDWTKQPGEHPYESTFLKLDASKARARLGWRPRLPVAQALEWTVEWYRAFRDGGDLRAVTESQIQRYSTLHPPPA